MKTEMASFCLSLFSKMQSYRFLYLYDFNALQCLKTWIWSLSAMQPNEYFKLLGCIFLKLFFSGCILDLSEYNNFL